MKKLAMIGCGGIGEYHLEHLVEFDDVELAGFCDIVLEKAERFVQKAGGKAFSDFRAMYDAVAPDMVFICVPPYCHGDIEFETIRRGIHMFVEKPVALDIGLARRIEAAAAEKGIVTAVGFQCRYDDINEAAKGFIAGNPVVMASGSRVGGFVEIEWFRDKKLSGGQLVEQTVHQMDMLRYLLGEPASVYSVARRGVIDPKDWPGYDTDDMSGTMIVFQNGVVCDMLTGCYSLAGASWDSKLVFGGLTNRMDYYLASHVDIYGQPAAAEGDDTLGVVKGDGTQRKDENEAVKIPSTVDFGVLCDKTFVDAAVSGDGSMIRSPYGDAVKTLAFVLACNESMATGLPVKL